MTEHNYDMREYKETYDRGDGVVSIDIVYSEGMSGDFECTFSFNVTGDDVCVFDSQHLSTGDIGADRIRKVKEWRDDAIDWVENKGYEVGNRSDFHTEGGSYKGSNAMKY